MAAEYHKRVFEIQQAITKREMHRLELEKDLSRVRSRKEANREKLKMKLRRLKQEVLEEEKKHRRSVDALLNQIKGQKKEYETLQARTRHLRARKDHLVYLNSLQKSLKTNSFEYNEIYWPTIKDSSSQTEPETKVTTIIARSSINSEVAPPGASFYGSELSRNQQKSIFGSGSPLREMQKTEQVRNYYRITPHPEETLTSNQYIPHSGNVNPISLRTQDQNIFFPTNREGFYNANENIYPEHYQNVDDLSKSTQPLQSSHDCTTIHPEENVYSPKAQTSSPPNFLSFHQDNEDLQTTVKVPESRVIPTQNPEAAEKAEHENIDNKILVEKEENNQLESNYLENFHEPTEHSFTRESAAEIIKTENKTTAKSLKLVSFTPVKNSFSEKLSNVVPESSLEVNQNAATEKEDSPKTADSLNTSVNRNAELSNNVLCESITPNGTNIEGVVSVQEEPFPRTIIEITKPDSPEGNRVNDSPKLSLQLSQSNEQIPKTNSLKPPATEILPNSEATSDRPSDISKTAENKAAKREKEFQYESNIFDQQTPEKSTEAYKQMLRRISHEPLGHDEESDHNKASNDLLNYDAESIDSVEAAIQAATKGEVAEKVEPDSPSSTSTVSENNKTVATLSPAVDPPAISKSISKEDGLNQIKKTFLSKPARSVDPLKISLDSDSESLSPMSAGDDPSDNDDSFY